MSSNGWTRWPPPTARQTSREARSSGTGWKRGPTSRSWAGASPSRTPTSRWATSGSSGPARSSCEAAAPRPSLSALHRVSGIRGEERAGLREIGPRVARARHVDQLDVVVARLRPVAALDRGAGGARVPPEAPGLAELGGLEPLQGLRGPLQLEQHFAAHLARGQDPPGRPHGLP